MTQMIELPDKDLEKVDRLVKSGLFSNREDVVKAGLESLLQLSEEEIKRIEKAKSEADMFLWDYRGDALYSIAPSKVIIDGKELYKTPVKSSNYENSPIFGYVYLDAQTLEVDVDLSTGFESLHEMSDDELEELKKVYEIANSYCERNLDGIYAGAPRKLNVEGEQEFEVVVKGKFNGKTLVCGYLFLDANTLNIKEVFIDRKRIDKLKAGENINEGSVL